MLKFHCDYCDTYLTHDPPSVSKIHCSGRKHKENVKDYSRKWMITRPRQNRSTKQRLHFNKERSLRLGSLLLCLQGPWSHLPPVSRVLLSLAWCLHPSWKALPWCQCWAPLLLGWCLWDQLLGWDSPREATCPWCSGLQWWDLLPALRWCPHGPDQTDKSRRALYCFLFPVLFHQILVLSLSV
jgi:U1 small nuclear ribonucleoprotein C